MSKHRESDPHARPDSAEAEARSPAPSRRQVLAGLGATLGVAAIGCGSDAGGGDPALIADAAPDALDPHALCNQPAAMTPEELLAHIDTIVVLCMENRSFDHYLGSLLLAEGRADVNGLTGRETNPNTAGEPIAVHLLEDFTPEDPPHGWDEVHAQWNGGANDGFVLAHAGDSENDVMGYHVREQLPILYALADNAAICHNWYCSVLGPTWPNRFYLHGATSKGQQGNFPVTGFDSIFGALSDAGISHQNYFHDVAWASGAYLKLTGLDGIEKFFDHAASGTLPQFSIIDPKFFGAGANDDHPDHDIQLGQALIASIFNALAQSPQWERSLFVLTYDEHGGFYDHVAPPPAEDGDVEFRRLGFRVPSIVAGPTVRRGCAIDAQLEHVSVVSTLTRRYGLEPLNARVTATNDLSTCIDPALIGNPLPAPELPALEISMRELARRAERRPAAGTHHELAAALAARPIPRHLDRRDRGLEVTHEWLRRAARVGAVRLRD